MISLGLKASERRAYERALVRDHVIDITVRIMTRDHKVLRDVSGRLIDGQVDFDRTGDVTRSASLQLHDPHHSVGFDGDDPGDGAVFANHLIRIIYSVKVDELKIWVHVPIFTGPVTGLSRDGSTLNIECQGKETMAMGNAWKTRTIHRGDYKNNVLRLLLGWAGERQTRMNIPPLAAITPEDITVYKMSSLWGKAKHVARSTNRQLFYNGRGIAVLRRPPQKPVYTFRTGTHQPILTEPDVTYDSKDFFNTVWVVGGKPKNANKRIESVKSFPASHPLSPRKLGRNGFPFRKVEKIENDQIRSQYEADAMATRRINNRANQTLQVTFESMPIPHLEEGDMCAVYTDDYSMIFRLNQFSIPLSAGANMTVGFNKPVPRPKVKKPRKPRKPRNKRPPLPKKPVRPNKPKMLQEMEW